MRKWYVVYMTENVMASKVITTSADIRYEQELDDIRSQIAHEYGVRPWKVLITFFQELLG